MKLSLKLNSVNSFWLALGGSNKPEFWMSTQTSPSRFSNPDDGVDIRKGVVFETRDAAAILSRFY
jgi:hypothetical protein